MVIRLSERWPEVSSDRLLSECVPPPRFADVRFSTYRPDPDEPS
jgi:cell division protein ZapE